MMLNSTIDPILFEIVLKASVVVATGTLVVWLLRRASAALRHQVWAATVISLLALPPLVASLPGWHLDFRPISQTTADPVHFKGGQLGSTMVRDGAVVAVTANDQHERKIWLFLAWILGSSVVGLWLLGGVIGARRLQQKTRPAEGQRWSTLSQRAGHRASVRRPAKLAFHSAIATPIVVGLTKPLVILPERAKEWPDARLEDVLVHELAHVQRADNLFNLLARIACALFWFHPLVWFAAHRMRVEREHAADDVVVASGSSATEYAEHLLSVARGLSDARPLPMVALINKLPIGKRIAAIIDPRRNHRAVSKRGALISVLLAVALIFPLACATNATGPTESPTRVRADQKPLATFDAGGTIVDLLAVDMPTHVERYAAFPMTLYWRARNPFLPRGPFPPPTKRWRVFVHFDPPDSAQQYTADKRWMRFQGDHTVMAPPGWSLTGRIAVDRFAVLAGHVGYAKGKYGVYVGWFRGKGKDDDDEWDNATLSSNSKQGDDAPGSNRLYLGEIELR